MAKFKTFRQAVANCGSASNTLEVYDKTGNYFICDKNSSLVAPRTPAPTTMQSVWSKPAFKEVQTIDEFVSNAEATATTAATGTAMALGVPVILVWVGAAILLYALLRD